MCSNWVVSLLGFERLLADDDSVLQFSSQVRFINAGVVEKSVQV
jgi:hypothetical protein